MKKINNILKWAFSECGLRKIEAVTTIITAVAGIAITAAGIIITMKVANIQNELSLKNSTFILQDNVDVELASEEYSEVQLWLMLRFFITWKVSNV